MHFSLAQLYAYSVYAIAVDVLPLRAETQRVDDKLQKALGKRVRQLRLKKGFSQEAFADHCGVHRTFMGTIERGESNLSLQNVARIAAGLDITLSRLFSGIETKVTDTPGEKMPRPDGGRYG